MTVSPTRKRLERRRGRLLLALGVIELLSALIWRDVTDLDFAEGKKASGVIGALTAVAFLSLGILHIRESKDKQ